MAMRKPFSFSCVEEDKDKINMDVDTLYSVLSFNVLAALQLRLIMDYLLRSIMMQLGQSVDFIHHFSIHHQCVNI